MTTFQRGLNLVEHAKRLEEARREGEAHALYVEGIALCFAGIGEETDPAAKELHEAHLRETLARAEALKRRVLARGGAAALAARPPPPPSPSASTPSTTGGAITPTAAASSAHSASAQASINAARKAAIRAISLDEEYDREAALAFYEQSARHFDAARRALTSATDAPTRASIERDLAKYLTRAEAISAFFVRSKQALAQCRAEDDEDLLRAIHQGRRQVAPAGTPGAAVPTPPETRSADFSIAMEAARAAVRADSVAGDYGTALALYDRACEYLMRAIKLERSAANKTKWSAQVGSYLKRAEELKALVGSSSSGGGGSGGGGGGGGGGGDAAPPAPSPEAELSDLERRLRALNG